MTATVKHINDVLPADFDRSGMHSSRDYWRFEDRAIQWLVKNNWKFSEGSCKREDMDDDCNMVLRSFPTGRFVTTDGDSFGPMVRMLFAAIDSDGNEVDLLHG